MSRSSKRGASEAIMFVLFVGFVVALAGIIFFYQKGFVGDSVEGTIRFGESRLECQEVFVNVLHKNQLTDDGSKCWVRFTNTGTRSIAGLALREVSGDVLSDDVVILDAPLAAKNISWNNNISYSSSGSVVEAVPIVEVAGEKYACDRKIVEIVCAGAVTGTCNNDACDLGEGCETISGKTVLCDGARSELPPGATCVSCKVRTDTPF